MKGILLLACVPVFMWLVQTVALKVAGLPVRLRLDSRGAPHFVRTSGRAATQISILSVIVAYPMLRGQGVVNYYAALMPPTRSALLFIHGAAVATLFLSVLFGIWLATQRLEIDIHHSRKKWIRRISLLIPTALLGALAEEFLFRGVVLSDLLALRSLSTWFAILLGAVIFAGAHYVRTVKRRWTLPGHIVLGLLLCIAFVRTGNLWLPMGLHAGGIFMIMGVRPFVRYRGPAWVTGASIFPFAGGIGIACLAALIFHVWNYFGPR